MLFHVAIGQLLRCETLNCWSFISATSNAKVTRAVPYLQQYPYLSYHILHLF
jgi:hypothetical protein